MASTNDLKNGLVLNLDGQLWTIIEFQHVKPGKGGAFVRTTLKNVLSGKVVDKTFNAGVKVDTATVDKRDMTYLYKDGDDFVFMDGDTYDQIPCRPATVGDGAGLPAGEHRRGGRDARGRRAVRRAAGRRSSWSSRTPTPACRATGRPAAPSRRRWRPARRSRCRCSSTPARRSRWTPATGAISAGPELAGRPEQGAQARARRAATRPTLRGSDPRDAAATSGWPTGRTAAGAGVRRSSWSRGWPSTGRGSTRCSPSTPRAGRCERMPPVDRAILRIAALRAALAATTCRPRS